MVPRNVVMRRGSRYGLGDVNIPFPWYDGSAPIANDASVGGTNWLGTASSIASMASSIAGSLTPIFAAKALSNNQSMMYNPNTGQYVISSGSLPLSLNASGANLSALSGWLPILGIGLVAVLGLKALSK